MEDDDDITTLINPQSVVDTQVLRLEPVDARNGFLFWLRKTHEKQKNKKNIQNKASKIPKLTVKITVKKPHPSIGKTMIHPIIGGPN